jgi:hypothetical protein
MQILKALLTGNKEKDFIVVSIINGKNASELHHHLHHNVEMVNVNQEKVVVVAHKIAEVAHQEEVAAALALKLTLALIHPILPQIKAPPSLGQ